MRTVVSIIVMFVSLSAVAQAEQPPLLGTDGEDMYVNEDVPVALPVSAGKITMPTGISAYVGEGVYMNLLAAQDLHADIDELESHQTNWPLVILVGSVIVAGAFAGGLALGSAR